MNRDLFFMEEALEEAKKGLAEGEVPVGAVLTYKNKIIAKGHNTPISSNDPSCHAEVNTIREAARVLENYRLEKTSLYVTLEPCSHVLRVANPFTNRKFDICRIGSKIWSCDEQCKLTRCRIH